MRTFERDGWWCIANRVDPQSGSCYDRWGATTTGFDKSGFTLEADRVRPRTVGKASHEDPTTMVTLCPGHHRGTGPQSGRVWATSHRDLERAWLDDHTKHATCRSCLESSA